MKTSTLTIRNIVSTATAFIPAATALGFTTVSVLAVGYWERAQNAERATAAATAELQSVKREILNHLFAHHAGTAYARDYRTHEKFGLVRRVNIGFGTERN